MAGINSPIKILDEDMIDIVGKKKAKRYEITKAFSDYAKEEGLVDPNDGRYFTPDSLIKEFLSMVGEKPKRRMMIMGTFGKLTGGAARDAGLIDY